MSKDIKVNVHFKYLYYISSQASQNIFILAAKCDC